MRIHAIQTGTVAIKQRQVRGVGQRVGRRLNTLLDRVWTDPLPIYVWVIEHPEGIIVVDTGETARVTEPGYFPRWHPYYRLGVREWVRPEEEIGPQLRALGLPPEEVRWVVLTHLHSDHTGDSLIFPGRTSCSRARNISALLVGEARCVATYLSIGPRGSPPH